MSALGHKRTFAVQLGMSALPPKADMCGALSEVRFVPIADIAPYEGHRQDYLGVPPALTTRTLTRRLPSNSRTISSSSRTSPSGNSLSGEIMIMFRPA